jgi:hypothetical protein
MKSQRMPARSDGPERLLKEKVQCNSWTGRVRVSAVVALLFAVIVLASYPASAAVSPSQQNKSQALPKPVAEPMPAPAAAPEPTPTPPPPTPEQLPPRPPEIAWDGKQLSINADNSTLYDILMAVRSRLGTSIDVPASASSERVAVHLGPAPARAVLSALLEGSNYDYIIKARESNQNEIQSMIVTLRGEGSDKDIPGDRDTNSATMTIPGAAVRRPPGYSRSGKPAFQEQMAPEQESSSTPDPPTAPIPNATEPAAVSGDSNQPAAVSGDSKQAAALSGDSSEPTPVGGDSKQAAAVSGDSSQPAAVSGDSKQPAAQPVAETPVTSPVASPVEASPGGGDSNPLIIESTPATAGAVVGPTPTTPAEMSDQLQRMYELRRQMQAQQNRPTAPPPQP